MVLKSIFVVVYLDRTTKIGLLTTIMAYLVKKRLLKKHDRIGLYSLYWDKGGIAKCNPRK